MVSLRACDFTSHDSPPRRARRFPPANPHEYRITRTASAFSISRKDVQVPGPQRAKVRVMWIVRLALRRPYTFIVASLVLLLLTPFVLLRTPTDIFPAINIPVISVIWQYAGLDAQEMEQRILYNHERS